MILTRRDRPVKGAGEERGAARAGGPCKTHDEIRRPSQDDPCGAGRFWPIAALLVGYDASASLPPRASQRAKIGSVQAGQKHEKGRGTDCTSVTHGKLVCQLLRVKKIKNSQPKQSTFK